MSPKTTTPDAPAKKITRADIESKLRELQGEVDERTEAAKVPAVAFATVGIIAIVVVTYWFGRRKGRKRQMVLEIRRI